jgi:hypothetical protein
MTDVIVKGLPRELLEKADGEAIDGDERLAALYAGEMSYLDEHVGRLIEGLAERGILDDAIVVLTGDHGEAFWEHGDHWNHGLWVYGTTVRVPLVIRVSDGDGVLGAGTVIDEPVSTIDVVPTLLELLGLDLPRRVEGVSLVAALEGDPLERGAIFSQATQPIRLPEIEGQWGNLHKASCVRDGRWKYVHAPYNDYEELFEPRSRPGRADEPPAPRGAAGGDPRRARTLEEHAHGMGPYGTCGLVRSESGGLRGVDEAPEGARLPRGRPGVAPGLARRFVAADPARWFSAPSRSGICFSSSGAPDRLTRRPRAARRARRTASRCLPRRRGR